MPFEAMVLAMCRQMPVNAVASRLGVSDDALWRVVTHHVEKARPKEDFSQVRAVGIDETATRRGQNDITVFHDMERRRLLFACEGRNRETVAAFAEDLRAHAGTPESVTAACIDMSRSYISGVEQYLPNAEITFDRFHIIQLANAAVDEVRRQEVRFEPVLKKTRWTWLKDPSKHSWRQINELHNLTRTRLKTARAWRLKESLRDLLAQSVSKEDAEVHLNRWYSWARRCRLEPFKRLALTLKAHWQGILNSFDSTLTNGLVEGINSLLQAAKARARGYRRPKSFIAIAYLIAGNLSYLPACPYRRGPMKAVRA